MHSFVLRHDLPESCVAYTTLICRTWGYAALLRETTFRRQKRTSRSLAPVPTPVSVGVPSGLEVRALSGAVSSHQPRLALRFSKGHGHTHYSRLSLLHRCFKCHWQTDRGDQSLRACSLMTKRQTPRSGLPTTPTSKCAGKTKTSPKKCSQPRVLFYLLLVWFSILFFQNLLSFSSAVPVVS